MPDRPGRTVTLVLTTAHGRLLGRLPAFDVALPYWQEVADVVAAARAGFGVDVTVLRLLHAEAATTGDGGPVTYLAETAGPVPAGILAPWHGRGGDPPADDPPADDPPAGDPIDDDPRRAAYARPGGPAADLAWARARLAEQAVGPAGTPRQIRTWNLSSIWQLPTTQGLVWLKVAPAFLAREAAVLAALAPGLRPAVLAAEGPRVLLGDVPGDDQYGATGERVLELAGVLADLQEEWRGRTDRILGLGGRDRRAAAAVPAIRAVLERHRGALAEQLDAGARSRLDALVGGLERRFADVDRCGLPDTLVHGDFHPGNLRGRPGAFVVLDWGEAGAGHPALDLIALTAGLGAADRERVEALLADRWQHLAPGSDLPRAVELLRPVVPLLGAVTYQGFLDAIEPDEHPYHAADPLACLLAATPPPP